MRKRVTERDGLGKKIEVLGLGLSWIKVSLSYYHIYYVRIIDSKILWNVCL